MLKLLKLFAWTLIAIIFMVSLDQFLMRVPLTMAGARQAQTFYVDFRNRLLGLIGLEGLAGGPGETIEQVIEASQEPEPRPLKSAPRYLYVDDAGALQFADSFDQVPAEYRENAQPLAE